MKYLLISIGFIANAFITFAQDTTWVQTFTFDSIETRRAVFEFPQELNQKRFEKVLMYYKLKCSPLTTWDQYNCGEWDYLTYTTVYEHTGAFDSVEVNSSKYKINTQSPSLHNYRLTPFFDTYQTYQYTRNLLTEANHDVLQNNSSVFDLIRSGHTGNKVQFILTAQELINAGIVAGDITSLMLNVLQTTGQIEKFTIRIKATGATELMTFDNGTFMKVFEQQINGLNVGSHPFVFSTPYTWDGTSNLVVEFSYGNSENLVNGFSIAGTADASLATTVNYSANNGVFTTTFDNYAELDISNDDLSGDVSIAFWAKGNGSAGQNTSILEAVDSLGQRVLNIHFPWSDNTVYFDAGGPNGYDRINKASSAAIMDDVWHHWVFIKKVSTGEMQIYLDGNLWHSGSGLTKNIGKIAKFILGSDVSLSYDYQGSIDEFSIFKAALSPSDIADWKDKKIDPSHPNYADLFLYYDFDDEKIIKDRSVNNRHGMPSEYGMIEFVDPICGQEINMSRPAIVLGQGQLSNLDSVLVNLMVANEPQMMFEYQATENSFQIVNSTVTYPGGTSYVYDYLGNVISSTTEVTTHNITNESIVYYEEPFELVNNVEISRYITPYGISFDLGPNGFSWIADVTDYQQYLKNTVDLSAHNTQELLDLKFAFIEGIPPRDVHARIPIWADFTSYNYGQMAGDQVLSAKNIALSDTSSMFKIKTRLTGHGHNGNTNCCEWDPKEHKILLDGQERFSWSIWQASECANNPNIGQGGTWPYAREGWCPGDIVKTFDHEITPYVTPGNDVSIDYSITAVPTNDQAQAGGNYVAAFDLISYSAPNFTHDAAVVDVLNPNNWEYYSKWNPTCSNPRIVLQNTGSEPLTSCIIRCWISYGDWLEYQWNGNLEFLEKEVVEIPVTDLNWWSDYNQNMANEGTLKFTAQVYHLNGVPNADEYSANDAYSTRFSPPKSVEGPFLIWFTTNNKASENKYRLIDQNGAILFERTSLANSTTYKDTFDLSPGCYSVILEDSDDDGIGFWYSAQAEGETSGQFRVKKVGGSNIEAFTTDFGRYHRVDFSVGFTLNVDEQKLEHSLKVFPNPNKGRFTIELNGWVDESAVVEVYDLMGQLVFSGVMQSGQYYAEREIDLTNLSNGNYIVKAITPKRVYTTNVIVAQ